MLFLRSKYNILFIKYLIFLKKFHIYNTIKEIHLLRFF